MKKIITYAIIAFGVISPTQTQAQDILLASSKTKTSSVSTHTPENRLNRELDVLTNGLNETMNSGIESSLFKLLDLRLEYPYSDFSSAIEKLTTLSVEGNTSSIRYKAHITLQYIIDPVLFLEIDTANFIQNMDLEKADKFYLALSQNLHEHISSDSKE